MVLGISPFLCDYYLLFWELKWCETQCKKIRNEQPNALSILPTILTTCRYLDDILYIFPLGKGGADSLKKANGGPYPDSLGITSEQRGETVHFLDVKLS